MGLKMYVLYEHAVGYALFYVKQFEEIASQIPKVEKLTTELMKFKNMVELSAFAPHKTASATIENAVQISEGNLHDDLVNFLDANLPKKRSKITLGVADPKMGSAIQERFQVQCQHVDVVPEILRGIKLHADKLISDLSYNNIGAAEASLAHSVSRTKVKFNVNRSDNMITQSIALLDQLDANINTFSMRLREWYGYHFPELVKTVPDMLKYAKIVHLIGDRKKLAEDEVLVQLNEITEDEEMDKAILNVAKTSMGMDIAPLDLVNISNFAARLIAMLEQRQQNHGYLIGKMHTIAPNLTTLIGETVGARLISHAGNLVNLAKYPASTVQILGAEKALFRALKTRGNTPKHGLIYHSAFISKAANKSKGQISRFLANKCSIASRIDCFSDKPDKVYGTKLREQVEERLKFYQDGTVPRKNIEVMTEALSEITENKKKRKLERKSKKNKRVKVEEDEGHENGKQLNGDEDDLELSIKQEEEEEAVEEPPKKKKKKNKKNKGQLQSMEVS